MNYSLGNMLGGAGALNADKLSLDLQFAADKTLTARKGPTPTFTRASTATFVGSDGLIQSAAINAARFDHDPVTLACKGLLIEESRTNLLQRSEELDNAYWGKTATTVGGAEASPSGAITADVITASVGAGRHIIQRTMAFTAASHTFSIFIKKGSNRWAQVMIADNFGGSFGIIVDLDTGLVTDSRITSVSGTSSLVTAFPNGWYRVSATVSASAGTWYAIVALSNAAVPSYDVNNNPSFIALGTETIFAWGAQLEAGSFPTSYIPTVASSVVRSADLCSITGAAFTGFYNQSEGTFAAEYDRSTNLSSGVKFNWMVFAAYNPLSPSTYSLMISTHTTDARVTYRNAGTDLFIIVPSLLAANTMIKASYGYKSGDFGTARNGVITGTGTAAIPTVSTFDRIEFGFSNNGSFGAASGQYLNGHIASIRYFKKRLANAKLQAITV
jgi:hypothetical protein